MIIMITMFVLCSKDQRAIIYVDFVKDAAPLSISLYQAGYSTCSYHGQKLSSHDKLQSIEGWRNGSIKVMVCTTAFSMGIDQPVTEVVIRIGVPYTRVYDSGIWTRGHPTKGK